VNTANAYIAGGAEVSAADLIDVSAARPYQTLLPTLIIATSDFWGWFQTARILRASFRMP